MYKSYTCSKERKKDPEPLFFRPAAGNTQNQMFDPEKRQEEEMARHFMNDQAIFWIGIGAYALHMMEEFFYDWKNWANNILKLPVDWPGFYVTNTAVLFLGIACASVGWNMPAFSLIFPALMLINAFFFHVVPFVVRRKFSPGLITAIIFFFPIGYTAFKWAEDVGVSSKEILFSFLFGGLLMAFPIVLLKTKSLPFFKQSF